MNIFFYLIGLYVLWLYYIMCWLLFMFFYYYYRWLIVLFFSRFVVFDLLFFVYFCLIFFVSAYCIYFIWFIYFFTYVAPYPEHSRLHHVCFFVLFDILYSSPISDSCECCVSTYYASLAASFILYETRPFYSVYVCFEW